MTQITGPISQEGIDRQWKLNERHRDLTARAKRSRCMVCRSWRVTVVWYKGDWWLHCDCWPTPPQLRAATTKAHVAEKLGDMVMTELARIERQGGDLSTLTSEDIKQYICPEATTQECIIFLRFCLAQQLNPFAGDVFLVKYGGREPKASIQIGLPVYLRRASANPNYAGYAAGVIVKDNTGAYVDRDGAFLYPGDELFGAWARVHRKGAVEPLVHKVTLREYLKDTAIWRSKTATMIVVTATRQAIRRMFPETEQQIMDMYGPRFEGMMLEDLKDPEDVDLNPVLGEIAGREEPPPVPTTDDDYGLFGDAPATGGHSSVDTETGEIFDPPDNGGTPPVGDPPAFSEGAQPPPEDPDPITPPEPPLTPEQMDSFLEKAEKAGLNQKIIEERIGGSMETHLVPWGRAQGCTSTTETILRLQ